MLKQTEKLLCMLFVTAIMSTMFASASVVNANPDATMAIVPSNIVDPSISPGSTIVINVSIFDAVDLYTWQVKVYYKPTLLNCTGATYPSDHVFAGKPMVPVSPIIDPVEGSMTFGATLMGAGGVNGGGRLCQVTFNVLGRGFSHLNFSTPYGTDTFVLNSVLDIAPATTVNGYFDNRSSIPQPPVASFDYSPKPVIVNQWTAFDASASYDPDGSIVSYLWNFGDSGTGSGQIVNHKYTSSGTFNVNLTVMDNDGLTDTQIKEVTVYESRPAKLYVDPPEIIDPTLFPPALVTVNVTVNDVINMYDYEFKLSYNTEMLTCIGAIINRVQNQTSFVPVILIDDWMGYIWVNVTYRPPAVPISTNTPLALVTIFFQVDAPGSSILHLSETELSDPARQPMPHETADGFIMTLIRDVAITHVAPSTNWAYQSWPVDITVTAKNNGNISETFNVKVYYDGNLIATLPVINLPSNAETTMNATWNTTGVPEGNYTISAEATAVPFEFNTTNNYLADGTVQIFTQIRDVAITDVTASRNWVFPGIPVNITVTAKNLGEVTESFDVKVYYGANLLGTRSIIDLPPATEIVEVFIWNTTGLTPCNNFTISAEATTVPYEYDTSNNVFIDGAVKIRYIGDINGDGKVNMLDIAIAASAFGSYPGHPRWNPDADITGAVFLVPDGHVDMRDIALICKHFGEGC